MVYDTVSDFNNGIAIVKLNGKWTGIYKNGEEVKSDKPIVYDISSHAIKGDIE